MPMNKITIKDDTVIGGNIKAYKFLNLTSLPDQSLMLIIKERLNFDQKPKFINLYNGTMFDEDTSEPVKIHTRPALVTIFVDSDDNYKNVKIKSLTTNMKIVPMTLVVLEAKQMLNMKHNATGTINRFASYQHTFETIKSLNASIMMTNKATSASLITIVRTKSIRCGSISGMMMLCNMLGKSYEIEENFVKYTPTWIDQPNKYKFIVINNKEVKDTILQGDMQWSKKLGYMNYVSTPAGIKRLMTLKKKEKTNYLSNIFNYVKTQFLKLIKIIKDIFMVKQPKPKFQLAFGLVDTLSSTIPHAAAAVTSMQSKNASKDINESNRVIAGWKLNQMLAKSGTSGSKLILNKKRSPAMNSYIANMTSFNTTEAITNANNLAASRYKFVKSVSVLITLAILTPFYIISGKLILIIIAILIFSVDYYTDILPLNQLIYTIAVLMSTNILTLIMNTLALIMENVISESKTARFRAGFFLAVSCLISLF